MKKDWISLNKIKKPEDEDLKRFKNYLRSALGSEVYIVDKPDMTGSGRFDYLLGIEKNKIRIAVELTQIFESEKDRIRSIQWGNAVGAIREQLREYLDRHEEFPWQGVWCVETPENFGVTKALATGFAKENTPMIIEAIREGRSSISVGSFALKIEKVADRKIGDVYFSTRPYADFIDTSGTIIERLEKKLPIANEQLDTNIKQKMLLLVSRYAFGGVSDVIEALFKIEEIWRWKNFDKIYLEDTPGHFVLVFDKELRKAWNGEKFNPIDESFLQTFQLWVRHLRKNNPERTLKIVKLVVGKDKPFAILPNTSAREEVVGMGNYFIEKGKLDNARWIVEKFIADPDPIRDGGGFDFDKKIREGEYPHIITSVRGKLCWVIQKLALKRDTITESLKYAQRLLKYNPRTKMVGEDNLYVIQQAIIPLIEITRRRIWLKRIDKKKGSELHSRLCDVLFALLRNKNLYDPRTKKIYPAIAKYLLDAFSYYRELNEKQAKEVLDSFEHIDESALLFIYFAIYRKRHFGGGFNPQDPVNFEKLLEEKIKNGEKNLQRKIAWHFWRILDDDISQVENLEHYITVLSNSPYDRQVFGNLDYLIEVVIKNRKYVKLATEWFGNTLNGRLKWTRRRAEEDKNFSDWMHYDAIFEGIAKHQPDTFLSLLEKAIEIIETGQVYFHDVRKCFEASKSNSKLDEKRGELDDLWERVRKIYPRADNHWHD